MGLLQSNLALTQRDNTWGRCSGLRSLSKRPLWVLRVLLRRDRLYLFSLHMLLDLGEERSSGARKGGRDLCENEWGFPASQRFQSPTLLLGLWRPNTTRIWPQAEIYYCKARLFLFACYPYFSTTLFSFQSLKSDVSSQHIHSAEGQQEHSGTCADFKKKSNTYWFNFY